MNRKRPVVHNVYLQRSKRKFPNAPKISEDETEEVISETKSALARLCSLFNPEKFTSKFPPVVMKHQVYAFVKNRTEADKVMNTMCINGEIRFFKLGGQEDELAVVFMKDYRTYVFASCEKNPTVENFINDVVTKCPDVSYNTDTLRKHYSLTDEDINEMVQHGLLTLRDVGCWWLAIPRAGEYVKALLCGRKAMLQFLRRSKYKEILQSELEQRNLPKKAKLGNMYYIYDMIGADLVK